MADYQPDYLALYLSGELRRRAERLKARLEACDICPRKCGVNRLHGELGFCHSGAKPIVSSYCAHHGEEPVLSGSRGSGTIFFGNCNMRCVYCQNYQISQDPVIQRRYEVDVKTLASYMLYLQDTLRCHNINLVTPSHFVPQIAEALLEAVPKGLRLPLVYNTSSYDALATLRELDGIISIYLADLRYGENEMAKKYSAAADYVEVAQAAIKEMQRQVGDLIVDEHGIAQKGLIIRHLILPHRIAGSHIALPWLLKEVSPKVSVSIMSQYYPAHQAHRYKELSRKITPAEYWEVVHLAEEIGIENGWLQGMASPETYLPDFEADEPFAPRNRQG